MKKIFALLLLLISFTGGSQTLLPGITSVSFRYTPTAPVQPKIVLELGDSMDKTSDGSGTPTPITGAGQEWNGTALVNLTGDSYNTNGGTIFPQLVNTMYTRLGLETIVINQASSGSSFSPYLDANNWTLGGDLYTAMLTEVSQCLAAAGRDQVDIIIINCGVNDSSDGSTIGTVETDLKDFFARLEVAFPGVPKLVRMNGSYSTASYQTATSRQSFIRKWLVEMCKLYSDVYPLDQNNSYYAAGEMISNTAHRDMVGQNHAADKVVRWIENYETGLYSKWALGIIASIPQEITTAQKAAIETFVQTPFYQGSDFFVPFANGISKIATMFDWCFLGAPYDGGFTYSSSGGITTDAATSHFYRTGFVPNWSPLNGTSSDFWFGAYIGTNTTAAATAGSAIGSGTNLLEQTTGSVLFYRCNDGTTTNYSTDTKFQNNTLYASGRSSGTKFLWKNTAQVSSASVVATTMSGTALDVGARNTGLPPGSFLSSSFKAAFAGKASVDKTLVKAAIDNLITNLQ